MTNNGKPRSPLTNLCVIMISRVRIACRPRPPRRYTGLKARRKQPCFLEQPRRRKAFLTLQTLQGDEGYYFPSSISKYNVRFKSNAASSAVKMSDIDHAKDVNNDGDNTLPIKSIAEATVEELYSRKTPLEHVLLRPAMYVGATQKMPPSSHWVLDPTPQPPSTDILRELPMVRRNDTTRAENETNPEHQREQNHQTSSFCMVKKECGFVPALVKVFDEILVNASDNRLRHPESCTRIDVLVDPGSDDGSRKPLIRIYNDGKGIPVAVHQKEGILVPEMLFGHLLTGSNFDDNQKRVTGGRHGYGAKLTNIFSKEFTVETCDTQRRLFYKQTWSDNMTVCSEPVVTQVVPEGEGDYTCISFVPDLARLTGDPTATTISDADYAIMCRRVVDVAGCAAGQLQVSLNGINVSQPSFTDYCNLYRSKNSSEDKEALKNPFCFQSINDRVRIGFGLSNEGAFESVSFVNGMATTRGGTHVNVLVQQISKRIQKKIEREDSELARMVSPALIRRCLFVFCDALVENPTFDSQMKEFLTSSVSSFGRSFSLPTKFLNDVVMSKNDGGPGIMEEVMRLARGRQQASLLKNVGGKKTNRQILSIPKLEDAHMAGSSRNAEDYTTPTLILTEGDSAKALAVAGLEVIGRELYGVFPLRGKFLNVRDAPMSRLTKNAEVKALCSIIGLDFGKEYDTVNERLELRYGHVMLMTDQDTDGSHIKGLVINFFRHFWPKLLKPPIDQPEEYTEKLSFLSFFVTPLLKARKRGSKEVLSFFTAAEFSAWRASIESKELKKWQIKYYKGLGTNTAEEAKEYFSRFSKHIRPFHWNSKADGEQLDMVFDKKRAQHRREWLLSGFNGEDDVSIYHDDNSFVSYEDFVNKELIQFSNASNIRSIPSLVDGLKPSQRKVLYACFKRNLKTEIKVAQLAGYCAEHTSYHHGEASLQSTIIGMAQDFVGSNNVNLLTPSGQFGTRLEGGSDAASPRYIFTFLSPIARLLFPEEDDILLNFQEDEGQVIEPEYFCPIIPLLLVNGSMGIGTGWSTLIPPHNPLDLVDYIRAKLDNERELPPIRPFTRGFTGTFETKPDASGHVWVGRVKQTSKRTLIIDELPVGCWTNSYKQHLLKLRDRGEITSFVENHTTSNVSFTVTLQPAQLKKMKRSGLEKALKLQTKISTINMHAFDHDNNLRKFESVESIADAFFSVRLDLYNDRKSVLESETNYSAALSRNKAKFIRAVTTGEIPLIGGKQTKDATVSSLSKLGLATSSYLKTIRNDNVLQQRHLLDNSDADTSADSTNANDFDYLLNMSLSSLTTDKIDELQSDAEQKEKELRRIQATTPEDLWRNDLEKLSKVL